VPGDIENAPMEHCTLLFFLATVSSMKRKAQPKKSWGLMLE
jgi:hypothetical protein